jgi:hypothetical protein
MEVGTELAVFFLFGFFFFFFSWAIYIRLQLCKMTDARASHINAKQGAVKAQNTIKVGQLNKAFKCPSDGVVGRLVQRMSHLAHLVFLCFGVLNVML